MSKYLDLLAKIDDILFLLENQLKTSERLALKGNEASEKIYQIISDTYLNHPNNTQGQKAGRWANYSQLADKLEIFTETQKTSKEQQSQITQNLLNTAELLEQFKQEFNKILK